MQFTDSKVNNRAPLLLFWQQQYLLFLNIDTGQGAKVMLTMNLWPSIGLCNGATGIVVDIISDKSSASKFTNSSYC